MKSSPVSVQIVDNHRGLSLRRYFFVDRIVVITVGTGPRACPNEIVPRFCPNRGQPQGLSLRRYFLNPSRTHPKP